MSGLCATAANAAGEKDRDAAIKDFKQTVSDNLGIEAAQ